MFYEILDLSVQTELAAKLQPSNPAKKSIQSKVSPVKKDPSAEPPLNLACFTSQDTHTNFINQMIQLFQS